MTILGIDYFISSCQMIHFFGLGFVQVKVSDSTRYHFYHPKFSALVESPHDHRYWFRSEVLRGSLTNKVWNITNVENYYPDFNKFNASLRFTSCLTKEDGPEGSEEYRDPFGKGPARIFAKEVTSFVTNEGSGYYMTEDTFHQVVASTSEPCITRLVRGPKVKDLARVAQLDNLQEECPFSRKLPESDLWDIVRECLT